VGPMGNVQSEPCLGTSSKSWTYLALHLWKLFSSYWVTNSWTTFLSSNRGRLFIPRMEAKFIHQYLSLHRWECETFAYSTDIGQRRGEKKYFLFCVVFHNIDEGIKVGNIRRTVMFPTLVFYSISKQLT
jgi:hypothetical protein